MQRKKTPSSLRSFGSSDRLWWCPCSHRHVKSSLLTVIASHATPCRCSSNPSPSGMLGGGRTGRYHVICLVCDPNTVIAIHKNNNRNNHFTTHDTPPRIVHHGGFCFCHVEFRWLANCQDVGEDVVRIKTWHRYRRNNNRRNNRRGFDAICEE